ncbi:MAG: nitrilase-related carbon-nitrogen hydrolase [Pseudomonadota bacterium]
MASEPKDQSSSLSRRQMMKAMGTASTAAAAGVLGAAPAASAQTKRSSVDNDISVAADGNYERVALRKDVLRVTAIQSPIHAADAKNPKPVMTKNLNLMLDLIDSANGFPGPQDLICFHEQPIMGWNPWTREEALKVAIEVPGEETEALGKKAKQYGCYIAFGTYARDKDWPGHLLLNGVLIGPDGEVVAQHWKQHNVRLRPDWTMYTTSVYDVLDRFVEMYGADAVLPVARTDIGNLSLLISPYDPDIHRALSIKGMEIGIRFSSGGFNATDSQSSSLFNQNYTITINQSLSPDQPGFPDYSGSGGTSIYGPFGKEVAMAKSVHEEFIAASIPIGDFRKRHKLPDIPMALVMPVYEKYRPPLDPGLQLDHIPDTPQEAARYFNSKRNW